MWRSTAWTYRNFGRIAATTATIAIVACVDWSQSTKPAESPSDSDFVATGALFSAVWSPTAAGAELRASGSVPVELSVKPGVVNITQRGTVSRKRDIEAAQRLRGNFSSSALLWGDASIARKRSGGATGLTKLAVRTRTVSQRQVDGKTIRVAVVEDAATRLGQPPRASLFFIDGRLAAIRESQYARRSGALRLARTRTTLLDSKGKSVRVSETDYSGLQYRSGVAQLDRATGIRDRVGRALSSVIRLAQPDVLEAAAVQGWGGCITQEILLASAVANAYSAWLGVESAENARTIAASALASAEAACVTPTEACLAAVERAQLGLVNADIAVERAWIAFWVADAAVVVASYNFWQCYNRPAPRPETKGGGDDSGGGGHWEEWCEYWVYTDEYGNEWWEEDHCWMEYAQ
jgi:hypothetical protein